MAHICNFVTGVWRYEGWYFEFHEICGPTWLKKNGDPRSVIPPDSFWRMWERFSKLPPEEKKKYEAR